MLPKLEKSPEGARVVNVSSKIHAKADTLEPEIISSKQHFSRFKMGGLTYARSKLAQVSQYELKFLQLNVSSSFFGSI